VTVAPKSKNECIKESRHTHTHTHTQHRYHAVAVELLVSDVGMAESIHQMTRVRPRLQYYAAVAGSVSIS